MFVCITPNFRLLLCGKDVICLIEKDYIQKLYKVKSFFIIDEDIKMKATNKYNVTAVCKSESDFSNEVSCVKNVIPVTVTNVIVNCN